MNLVFVALLSVLFAVRETLAHSFSTSVFARWGWNPQFWNGLATPKVKVLGFPVDGPRLIGLLFIFLVLVALSASHYGLFEHAVFHSFWLDVLTSGILWEVIYIILAKGLLYVKPAPAMVAVPPAPAAPSAGTGAAPPASSPPSTTAKS
jgi:hypothetical protein